MEIRILSRQGLGIRAIARQLDISRNTVRSYLRGEAVTGPERRGPGRPRTLEPYEAWLRKRVTAAAPIRLPATALHREIRAMGYTGTDRTVRRFLAALYPPIPVEPVVRYETPPGRQAQMDWGEYRLGRKKIYSFVGVLGYSRWLYVEYVESTCAEVLVACHRRMFQDFGGIPREMLYDNMRTVVARRDAYGRGPSSLSRSAVGARERVRISPGAVPTLSTENQRQGRAQYSLHRQQLLLSAAHPAAARRRGARSRSSERRGTAVERFGCQRACSRHHRRSAG